MEVRAIGAQNKLEVLCVVRMDGWILNGIDDSSES